MEFVSTALIVVITAALTAAFAMQRFKSETRWARKAFAYSQIRKAMRLAIKYSNAYIDYTNDFPDKNKEERLKELSEKRRACLRETESIVDNEYYFISPIARSAFHNYENRPPLPEYMDSEDMADAESKEAESLLSKIDHIAQKDLASHTTNLGQIVFSCLKKADAWLEPLAKRCTRHHDA